MSDIIIGPFIKFTVIGFHVCMLIHYVYSVDTLCSSVLH